MQPQLVFFVSVAFGFIAWGVVTARYIWPELRKKERSDALQPVLMLHSFRYLGLATLVPGVVSPERPYFIPTFFVPILLITHGLAFRILLQPQSQSVMQQNPQPV